MNANLDAMSMRSIKSMVVLPGAEDPVLKAIRAKRRFKALVRRVIANLAWLEDVEEEQLSRNVKKNVQLLTKRKGKKGLLTLAQKAILCKPAEWRTPEEKQLLYRIIGGLKCFRKYPENVKLQLAGVTYYVYYGANRTIVRQDHAAHALYFIISGEVTVSITTLDPVTKDPVTVDVGQMVAGSMFGEVSLLHDIPRTATIATVTPCEFLCLMKADFDIVLKASVKKQWDQIQVAMSRFSYFDGWNEVAVRECCIYSKIKPYVRDQTILGDGEGMNTNAYFVVKGKCRLIEHLLVKVNYDSTGKKKMSMYAPDDLDLDQEESLQDVMKRTVLDEKKTSATSLPERRRSSLYRKLSMSAYVQKSMTRTVSAKLKTGKPPVFSPGTATDQKKKPPSPTGSSFTGASATNAEPPLLMIDLTDPSKPQKEGRQLSVQSLPLNVETHFMQVCIFSELACFSLGENLKRRRVVALTDYVECLMIPRYWLFQHNRGNIWSRIQQYLDSQIPTTEKVFNEFVTQRKWLAYRQKLANEIFGKPPVTAMYDVPYSVRINEDIDF